MSNRTTNIVFILIGLGILGCQTILNEASNPNYEHFALAVFETYNTKKNQDKTEEVLDSLEWRADFYFTTHKMDSNDAVVFQYELDNQQIDKNNDGKLSYIELLKAMKDKDENGNNLVDEAKQELNYCCGKLIYVLRKKMPKGSDYLPHSKNPFMLENYQEGSLYYAR